MRLTFKPSAVPDALGDVFTGMVRSIFQQRRKTVLNALRPYAAAIGADAAASLADARVDPSVRPETLDLDLLIALAQSLKPKA